MKTKEPVLKPLALLTSVALWCALNLHAQTAPTITTQPASQTNLAGSSVTFSVAVSGTGPFTYQWQFNGADLPTNIITTVAGNGGDIYSGDGGAAISASLSSPYGVALDASGNLYIADTGNNRIRKVDTNNLITTAAGDGPNYPLSGSYSGDGGPATNASLNGPLAVTVDLLGNLFIADTGNNVIRKVSTNGIITTVAGMATPGFSGDGGVATNANLFHPVGVALDAAGNLYIADEYNQRVRKLDTNGIITTVAGNGLHYNVGGLPGGEGLYFGDGGTATNAGLNLPMGVAVDASGNLFIGDHYNERIRKVDTNGIITTVVGDGITEYSPDPYGDGTYSGDGGAATNAGISNPIGLALDLGGNLYIADQYNQRIRKVDANSIITTAAGDGSAAYAGDGGAATSANLNYPSGVAVDAVGNLYIADTTNQCIRVVRSNRYPILALNTVSTNNAGDYTVIITNPSGSVTSAVAVLTVVVPPSILVQPASQGVVTGSNATLSVTVAGNPPFYYSWYFDATTLVQGGTNASFTVSNMNTGNVGQYMVVITNAYGNATSQVATLTTGLAPSLTTQPASQTNLVGSSVTFSVAASGTGPFSYQFQVNGTNLPNNIITTVAGGSTGGLGDGGAATNAGLNNPTGAAFDAFGNLYIADELTGRIRKVGTNGIITTVAGNGDEEYSGDGVAAINTSLFFPQGVAFDVAGNLYIADSYSQRIRKVDINGIITTVAGNGSMSYSGDGGLAVNASLNTPDSVAADALGNLYIADQGNNRIRKVDAGGIITTIVGNGIASFYGDGGAATNASLDNPSGVLLGADGDLYIADTGTDRIRKVDTTGIITTVAGGGSGGVGGAATNASLQAPYSSGPSPLAGC